MEINFIAFGIGVSLGVNFLLLYTRKHKWSNDFLRWLITVTLLLIGLLGIFGFLNDLNKDFTIFSWCLTTPFIYNCVDRIFKKISQMCYDRDFYLWLDGSSEVDESIFGKNTHLNIWDKVFSMVLLFLILFLPLIGLI